MQVRYVMSAPPVTVPPSASVRDVAFVMRELNVGSVCVTVDDRLVGVVTDRDLVTRILAPGASSDLRVDGVMTRCPAAVEADAGIMTAYRIMRDRRVRRVPVVDAGRLVGVVTFDALFWLATQELNDLADVVGSARDLAPPL